MAQDKKDLCSIRIMFPVVTDEQAFELRTKIKAVFSTVPDVNLDFRIISGQIPGPSSNNVPIR